eukprot:gene10230-11974_t
MGANQSYAQGIERSSKPYILPVVIPANKLHSSSSIKTVDSSSGPDSHLDASKAAWYADREMLADILSSYESREVLGKGSSAQVFQVVHKETGKLYACKIVRKSQMNDERTMSTETEIMMRLKHENITQLHELYETSNSRWFIMELANAGTLQTALAEEVNYTEELVAGLFKQVLSGVKHLHDMGIVHRDLKQDNILVNVVETSNGEKKYVPKIADFGLSAVVGLNTNKDSMKMEREMKSFRKLKDMWGTKEYFAPEVYKKAYGPQVDVWSLGCVLYELLTGVTAFPERERPISLFDRYMLNGGKKMRRMYQTRPQWQQLSAEAQDLINKMLKISPTKRFSLQECLDHPFIRNVRSEATVRHTGAKSVFVSGKVETARSLVLEGARSAAVKHAEVKVRRLKLLAEQIEKEQHRQ